MSRIEIFKFTQGGHFKRLGNVDNAYFGAIAIWNLFEKKYLPVTLAPWRVDMGLGEYTPRTIQSMIKSGKTSENDPMNEVWDLWKNPKLTEAERIVMVSTFDTFHCRKCHLHLLIHAYRQFGVDCPGKTNLPEIADLLQEHLDSGKSIDSICINWTSVNSGERFKEMKLDELQDYMSDFYKELNKD